jgi:hypothetical protein
VSARDTRTGATRKRPGPDRERGRQPGSRAGTARRTGGARGGMDAGAGSRSSADTEAPVDRAIVGAVPLVARAAGALLVLAGLAGAVAPFMTYLVVGGRSIAVATGVGSALVALLVPLAHLVVGVVLVRGLVPKLGLAYAAVCGALAVGGLLIELYRGSASTARPAMEVLAGRQVLTSTIDVRSGWVLGVAALVLTVLAGVTALLAWGRTVMEDGGSLDPVRSSLAGAAVLLGVGTVLCLALPAADLPDKVVTDPSTGMQTVVAQEGPQALLERPGLALLGGLLLAGAVVLCSVVAPSLRPRLATVGAFLAIAVTVLAAALAGLRDALGRSALEWTVPGAGLLLAGLGYAALTLVAWRVRRRLAVVPRS